MKKVQLSIMAILSGVVALIIQPSCAGRVNLTKEEMNKLHPALQMLVEGREVGDLTLDVSVRADGQREYGVIIRAANPDEVRATGVPIGSVLGELITARLTPREMVTVAKIRSVRAIEPSTQNFPTR